LIESYRKYTNKEKREKNSIHKEVLRETQTLRALAVRPPTRPLSQTQTGPITI